MTRERNKAWRAVYPEVRQPVFGRFEAYDFIQPKGSGLVYPVLPTVDTNGVAVYSVGTNRFTVHDNHGTVAGKWEWGVNCYIPGERGWCWWRPEVKRWEIVGSYGLYRKAVADAAISQDGSGTVSIHVDGADSNQNVTAHNDLSLGAIPASAKLQIRYFPDEEQWVIVDFTRYKQLVRFTLDSAMSTATASAPATITHQYGPGINNSDTSITVHNLLVSGGTYLYEGDAGDAGMATWDSGQNYRINPLECA